MSCVVCGGPTSASGVALLTPIQLARMAADLSLAERERDEARALAEYKNLALLNICETYCHWYDHEPSGRAAERFYDAKCVAASAYEDALPWKKQ